MFKAIPIISTLLLVTLTGCPPLGGAGDPRIEILSVPPYGATGVISGRVLHVVPGDYRVAVYVYLDEEGGWWTRPNFLEPVLKIGNNGAWSADILSSQDEARASRIAVFLIRKNDDPPLYGGVATLPDRTFTSSVANDSVYRTPEQTDRLLFFSGREWRVKSEPSLAGPGPNLFSDGHDNVWVDALGRLHLKITNVNGVYHCAEVISLENFGYGTYVFHLDSPVANLDPNVVLGLFTWDDAPDFNHRELDIEFSRWGDPGNANAQYVVQPFDTPGNMDRFDILASDWPSVHGFEWRTTYVDFRSLRGISFDSQESGNLIHTFHYNGDDIPRKGAENARMNLWLMNAAPPTDGRESEVIVSAFEFMQ